MNVYSSEIFFYKTYWYYCCSRLFITLPDSEITVDEAEDGTKN
jgi:hypothetical protein